MQNIPLFSQTNKTMQHSEKTRLLDKAGNIILELPFLYTPTETITIHRLSEDAEPQKYMVKHMVDEHSVYSSSGTVTIRKIFIEKY